MQVVNPRQVQELRLYGLWHVSQQVRRRLSVALPQQRLWRAPSGRSKGESAMRKRTAGETPA